ncbi:hypothetical protein J3B02_003090 [Coemansia erecta]|uniref:Protein phosphatase inhibitor 2 n=1 Tax=Coemansia asiatica TaxID=1052880 RepID=A0A9W8CLQ1_9FUNG|nr:hypothetical protein LPJ64_000294 [Coemansia asiatica]KAJ2853553.1 hypothetical protein J3B02_003090 [Coemansia erecta]KAJ2859121.1 hypothetical protein FB639_005825 [Coemansia asiatica]
MDNCASNSDNHTSEANSAAHPIPFGSGQSKLKGILKRYKYSPEEATTHLRWDEDNIRTTEAQKDSKMKVDEPKTPFMRYNPELDADLQEMEDLKLTSDMSSRSSSVMSSPKRAQVVVSPGWTTDSEDEGEEVNEEEKAKHKEFVKKRNRHYHAEGKYVHSDVPLDDSDESLDNDEDDKDDDDEDDGKRRHRNNGSNRIANGAAVAKPNGTSAGFRQTFNGDNDGDFADVNETNTSNMEL